MPVELKPFPLDTFERRGSEMDGGDPKAGALLTAFNALIEVAPPERVVPVLRDAMLTLLSEDPSGPTGKRECTTLASGFASVSQPGSGRAARKTAVASGQSRGQRAGGMEAWLPLRDRVRGEMAARDIKHAAVAAELGITEHTLRAMLGKHVPGGRDDGEGARVARCSRGKGARKLAWR